MKELLRLADTLLDTWGPLTERLVMAAGSVEVTGAFGVDPAGEAVDANKASWSRESEGKFIVVARVGEKYRETS